MLLRSNILIFTVIMAASFAAPAQEPAPAEAASAQTADTEKKAVEEEIIVTGSRLRRKDLTTAAPITIISKEQVQASGKVSLGDFLQTMPEQGNAINTSVNNGGDGATRISLRGLGASRTLVLLNGRRFVPGGTGADASVDLNSIPTASIERLEVLKDGASAVYGSDAIAGVVNIITRKRMNGSEANAFLAGSPKGDGATYDMTLTTGTTGDRGAILFSGGYYQQKEVMAGDRDFSRIPLFHDYFAGNYSSGSGTIPQGRIVLASRERGVTLPNPNNDPRIKLYNDLVTANPTASAFIRDPTTALGWRRYLGAGLGKAFIPNCGTTDQPACGDGYNFQPENYLVTPQTRIQFFSLGETRIGGSARAYFEAGYVNRRSGQDLAPEPLLTDLEGVVVSQDNAYNPFGRDINAVRRRLLEFGRRQFRQDIDTFRVVGGLDGTLPEDAGPLRGLFWDMSVNWGRTVSASTKQGNIRLPKLQDALGPTVTDSRGQLRCANSDGDPIDGCVPLNLFGGPGSITQEMVRPLTYTGNYRGINEMASVQFNTSAELFKLMADKPVGIAAGYEYRMLQGEYIPDPITVSGETSGNKEDITKGRYHVNEGYAELSAPIVNNMTGVDLLELSAAIRAFNYSNFGSDTPTYKFGGRWRPIRDITLRGTLSTAFRAPPIGALFGGVSDNFAPIKDPCRGPSGGGGTPPPNCGAAANNGDDQSQLRSQVGGNTSLKPETANIFTAGIVLEPRMVKNFTVTVDFYSISVDKTISTIGESVILAGCYPASAGTAPKYCDLIKRDPNTNRIANIDNRSQNVGKDETSGIDLAIRYAMATDFGRFGFVFDGTWLNKFDRTLADGTVIKGKNTYDLGVYPEWKFLTGVNWNMGGLSAGVIMRYFSSFDECGDSGGDFSGSGVCYDKDPTKTGADQELFTRRVPSANYWDLYLSYALQSSFGKTIFSAGVNNLFDRKPSEIFNGFLAQSDPSAYDFMGRFIYARVGHNF